MRTRRAVTVVASLVGVLGLVTGVAAATFVAGPLVQVSGTSAFAGCTADAGQTGTVYGNSEVEPWLDVNPVNPSNLVGLWQQDRWSNGGARGLVAGVSTTGGATWQQVVIPKLTVCSGGAYQRATDPWVTFGPTGIAYQLSLSFNDVAPPFLPADFDHALLASRSTDGGLTWSDPVTVIRDTAPTVFNDKQSITADPTNARYVYAVWDRLVFPASERASVMGALNTSSFTGPAWFARSSDAGITWETPRPITDPGHIDQTIGNQIAVQPNGTLIDIFAEFNNENAKKLRGWTVRVLRSTDKGDTWGGPYLVDRLGTIGVTDPETGDDVRTGDIIPEIGVNRTTGALYAVWQDARFNGGTADAIAFSQSLDGGLTWSTPIKVNLTPAGIPIGNQQAFTPSVEVADDGTIGVTYYDYRNDVPLEPPSWTDYWFVRCEPRSRDCSDPASWTGERRLTPDSFDLLQAARAEVGGSALMVGDYMGLARDGNDFLALFIQSFAGDPGSVYFTRLALAPDCSDGEDNDGDGSIDMDDPGCIVPYGSPENPQCDNGIDDDQNGLVDADDPKCTANWPYWEAPLACGLGAEMAVLVPLIRLAARRRRRSI
jgi:hypothetical protein